MAIPEDNQLKLLDKKTLRLRIKELTKEKDDYLDSIGRLNFEVEKLNEERRLLQQGLEETIKNFRNEQNKNEILAANLRRVGDELQLAQANKRVSVILSSTIRDIKDKFQKKNK